MNLNPTAYAVPSHDEAFCALCSKLVTPLVLDFGEGRHEVWGVIQTDLQLAAVCPLCEKDSFLDPETREPIEVTVD